MTNITFAFKLSMVGLLSPRNKYNPMWKYIETYVKWGGKIKRAISKASTQMRTVTSESWSRSSSSCHSVAIISSSETVSFFSHAYHNYPTFLFSGTVCLWIWFCYLIQCSPWILFLFVVDLCFILACWSEMRLWRTQSKKSLCFEIFTLITILCKLILMEKLIK